MSGSVDIDSGSSSITLASPGNDFGGIVNLTGGEVMIRDANALTLGVLDTGSLTATSNGDLNLGRGTVSGDLTATSNDGTIGQSGALQIGGAGTIDAGRETIILASPGNDFAGTVNLTGGEVMIRDANALMLGILDTGSLTATSNGDLNLGRGTVSGDLTATSNDGTIGQSGALQIGGAGTIDAGAGAIVLTHDLSASLLTLIGSSAIVGPASTVTAGLTIMQMGSLTVNGEVLGQVQIESGALLGGVGTVGTTTIADGGTLSPGNSIGTLTVDGDLTFAAGSRFEVHVDPEGTDSDLVRVTGRATLGGGAVAHIGTNGEYDLRSTYTILSADTLVGKFDDVTSTFRFLTPDLIHDHDAGTVALSLARNDQEFASAALTRNQIATAEGIESIGIDAGHAVYDAIAQLADDDDLIRRSFDALSGEIHASARTSLIEDSRFVRNAANDRIRAAFGDAGATLTPVLAYGPGEVPLLVSADHAGPVFWSSGFGSWGLSDSDGNAASLDRSMGGLLIGADGPVGDWRLGIMAGYSHSRIEAGDRSSSASSDNYHLGLYGGTQWGDIALRTGAAYTWHDIDTNRAVSIPGLTESLPAGYTAGTFQLFGELGYGIDLGDTRLEPFVNLAHVHLHGGGFSETGGAAALSGRSGSTNVTFTTLGLRGEHAMALGTIEARLHGMVGWRHAFGDTTPESIHAFSAGDAFTIAGAPIARNSAVIEAGLDLDLTSEATFGLSYTGQTGSGTHDHGFRAGFSVRF